MPNKKSAIFESETVGHRHDFQALFDLNPAANFVLDDEGRIMQLNNAALKLYKGTKKKLIGQYFDSLVLASEKPAFKLFLQQIYLNKAKQSVQIWFPLPGGERYRTQIYGVASSQMAGKPSCYLAVDTFYKRHMLDGRFQEHDLSLDLMITASTLRAQENERKRISESLHDSVSQLLYGIKLNLDDIISDQGAINKIRRLLEMAIEETRNISFELAPSVLMDFGLKVTIEEMCQRLSTPKLIIKSYVEGMRFRMDTSVEINIFRIIQELVNNCIKHAAPSVIQININRKNNLLTIGVTDNGKGFDQDAIATDPGGSGLASIKNRLILVNGTLRISSEPNKGTKAVIKLRV